MKKSQKNKISYLSLFLFLLLFASCDNSSSLNKEQSTKEQNSEELAIANFGKQLNEIEDKLKDLKAKFNNTASREEGETYVTANFNIKKEGQKYVIENVKYSHMFLNAFANGLYQGFYPEEARSKAVKIFCEETGDMTICEKKKHAFGDGTVRQIRCIAKALEACFDAGGCAELCEVEATMTM